MRFELNRADVASEVMDGEVIAINLTTGHYYSFRGCADVVWAMALGGWSAAEIAERLAAATGVPPGEIRNGVAEFVDFLIAEGLLLEAPGRDREEMPHLVLPVVFEPATFEKFTDMEELLLVDPIHEVGEAGWPQRKP